MMKKRAYLVAAGFLILFCAHVPLSLAADESITLTTYYPSPVGVYKQLRLVPQGAALPTPCQEGMMYYDLTAHTFNVCNSGSTWQVVGSWVTSGTNIYNTNTGNVGIGTAAPAYKLDVTGDLRITGVPYRNGGDSAWIVPSDERLKDILGQYPYGINEILKLNPVRFRYKQNNPMKISSEKEYIGLIAQDVQKVIPEAVEKGEKGYFNFNSSPVIWAMLNAIKEQQQEIDRLKARIDRLETKVK
jgi:hypothetical protein